jgi:AbiV family abortive infection protein
MSFIDDVFKNIPQDKDPKSMVIAMRDAVKKISDQDSLQEFVEELREKVDPVFFKKYEQLAAEKKVTKRLTIALESQQRVLSRGPQLLRAKNIDEALEQCSKYISHVESCWKMGCMFYLADNYPFSVFFSILTIEETGKLTTLFWELISFGDEWQEDKANKNNVKKNPLYQHQKKHIFAAAHGALLNHRLDSIIGIDNIKKFLELVESGKIERLRQTCLYSELSADVKITPEEKIEKDEARVFTIIAGELMAEVLGRVPGHEERLYKAITEYEKKIGVIR